MKIFSRFCHSKLSELGMVAFCGTRSLWVSAFLAVCLLPACNQFNKTGLGVLPEDDLIGMKYTDTLTFDIETHLLDSVQTDEGITNTHIFGNCIDPQMGRISTGIYTQFKYSGSELYFGKPDSVRLDSVVLFLDLVGYYGRAETPQKMQIFEITQDFDTTTYKSNDSLRVNKYKELSNAKKLDFFTGYPDVLRVRLNDDFGDKILYAPADSLKDNDVFTKYIKGLYISTQKVNFTSREPGAAFYVGLSNTNSQTKLRLYYSVLDKDSVGKYNAKIQDFFVTASTNQFHSIKRTDFTSRLLGSNLSDQSHRFEFIQSGALIENMIKFPFLQNLGEKVLNKAELLLKVDPTTLGISIGTNSRYAPPVLEVFQLDSTGTKADYSLVLDRPTYDRTTGTYSLLLTNHFQRFLNGRVKHSGVIVRPARNGDEVNSASYIANSLRRAVYGGKNNPDSTLKPRLRVIYTTLPK
jgi:hypothetical protein